METTTTDPVPNEHASNEHAPGDHAPDEHGDGLLSRVKLIEDQPLESRATAYGQVHDELRQRLEGTDRRNY